VGAHSAYATRGAGIQIELARKVLSEVNEIAKKKGGPQAALFIPYTPDREVRRLAYRRSARSSDPLRPLQTLRKAMLAAFG